MKSPFLEKIPKSFLASAIPYDFPREDEAVIVIAETLHINALELPPEELQRAEEMTYPGSRRRYLAGRYLARGLLSQWFGISPQEISMALNPAGKPFLPQENMPYFSISHSDTLIAAVFSTQESGIDLEKERPLDAAALARRFFSPEEAGFLEASGSLHDFFRLWSCREAAIKGDGRGLALLLDSTRAECFAREIPHEKRGRGDEEILVTIGGVSWSAIPWKLGCGTHGAVAFREPPSVIRWCDLR